MRFQIIGQLVNLAFTLGVAWVVWRYYQTGDYPIRRRYETFWPRFWTRYVDAAVLLPIGIVASVLISTKSAAAATYALVIQQASYWIYSVGMHTKYGQTVGKMACKVKILDAKTELPITFRHALMRDLIPIVLSLAILPRDIAMYLGKNGYDPVANFHLILPFLWISGLWFAVEVLTMLTNDKRRALHDFIAGTIVVRTNAIKPDEDSKLPASG